MKKIYMVIGVTMFIVGVVIVGFLSSYIPEDYRFSMIGAIEIGLIIGGLILALYGWVQEQEAKK
jgi:hypothetical protein